MTPNTASSPYCTVSRLFAFHDWRTAADAVCDTDAPRVSKATLLDSTTDAGAYCLAAVMEATGNIDAACTTGKRYDPTDLAALTGAGKVFLEKLCADLAFWNLCSRRQPLASNPQNVPGAEQAMVMLEKLRIGERVFPFLETQDAGLPSTVEPATWNDPIGERQTVRQAGRLFGIRGRDRC